MEFWRQFDEAIGDVVEKYQKEMIDTTKEKQRIITYCEKVMKEKELKAETDCIKLIRTLESQKKHVLREIEA